MYQVYWKLISYSILMYQVYSIVIHTRYSVCSYSFPYLIPDITGIG